MGGNFADLVFRWRWPLAGALAAALAGGCLVNVTAARDAGIADWYMHLAMWVLLATWMLLALAAWFGRKRWRSVFLLSLVEALAIFWIVILVGKIPGEKILVSRMLADRPDLPVLWVSVGLLGLCVAGLQVIFVSALGSSRPQPPAESPTAESAGAGEPPVAQPPAAVTSIPEAGETTGLPDPASRPQP